MSGCGVCGNAGNCHWCSHERKIRETIEKEMERGEEYSRRHGGGMGYPPGDVSDDDALNDDRWDGDDS